MNTKALHTEYIVDDKGNRRAVLRPLQEWEEIVEDLEELDDIKAYDHAKSRPSRPVPFDEAVGKADE